MYQANIWWKKTICAVFVSYFVAVACHIKDRLWLHPFVIS